MHALRLDYQRSCKPVPWLGLGVLLVALAALAATADHYRTLTRQAAYWESKADRIEALSRHRMHAAPPLSEQAARAQMLEVKQANQVVRQLTLPWNALFRAVETAGGDGIALLSMEPDMQKGTVKISGEAKDLNALLNYVKQLSSRKVFGNVFLQDHKIQQTDPEKPLHFSLLADWKEAAP